MPARLPLAALLGIAAVALALWLNQGSAPTGRQAEPAPPEGSAGVFGPGKWVAPPQNDVPALVADAVLSQTDEGELLIDPALLAFFNQHFVEHPGAAAWQQTEHDLRGRLSGHVLEQALALAHQYQGYVGDYDTLLAAQNLGGAPDLARLRGWARQRHLLRQRSFGDAVALAWFDNDEANFATAIDELEQRAAGLSTAESVTDPVTDPIYGPSMEQRRRTAQDHATEIEQRVAAAVRSFGSGAAPR